MTQPVWPFLPYRGAPYAGNETPNHTELNTIRDQLAVAADGRAWTDVAVLKKWSYQNTGYATFSSRSLIRDPFSRRWLVFGGNTASCLFTVEGSKWNGSGTVNFGDLSPVMQDAVCAAANGSGIILAGCNPLSATTNKIRESSDAGATWATTRSIGPSSTRAVAGMTYSQSLSLWLATVGISGTVDGIYSSSDRVTWTNRSTLGPRFFCNVDTPSTIILGTGLLVAGTTANYARSVDGLTWTTETLPENVSVVQAAWDATRGKFFMSGATGIWSSSTGLTGSWTKVYTGTEQASLGAFGRVLMRGDGKASLDGGVTWFAVVDLNGATNYHVTATPYGVGLAGTTSVEVYLSQQIGF